jgi:membrane-bound lytic murein transglycosylase D
MKTMLNRKLVKTVLFTNALVFLVIISRAEGTQPPSDTTKKITDTAIQQRLDLSLLQAQVMPAVEIEQAPAIRLNKQAQEFVTGYLAKNSQSLEKIKQKSSSAFSTINLVLTKYKLPKELKYLAVIESELNPRAVSKVGAVGTWQLMPTTARLLSLKVTPKYDERKHLYKSTVAAAKYLNDLYDMFGDWLLVIAAYNSGPGPVLKAIKKTGSRNFWKIQHLLPAETRGHVKRFIGTHYYFEGKAGLTTLTREETMLHNEAMLAFMAKQNNTPEKEVPGDGDDQTEQMKVVKTGTVGILNEDE